MNRIIFSLFILTSCTIKNEFSINDWAYYRGDNSVSNYKPFDLINKDNVHMLPILSINFSISFSFKLLLIMHEE